MNLTYTSYSGEFLGTDHGILWQVDHLMKVSDLAMFLSVSCDIQFYMISISVVKWSQGRSLHPMQCLSICVTELLYFLLICWVRFFIYLTCLNTLKRQCRSLFNISHHKGALNFTDMGNRRKFFCNKFIVCVRVLN